MLLWFASMKELYLVALEIFANYPNAKEKSWSNWEVSEFLEKKYKVIEKFLEQSNFEQKVIEDIDKAMVDSNSDYKKVYKDIPIIIQRACASLRQDFMTFIEEESIGFKTKAAKKRGGVSFLDTGTYSRNVVFEVTGL